MHLFYLMKRMFFVIIRMLQTKLSATSLNMKLQRSNASTSLTGGGGRLITQLDRFKEMFFAMLLITIFN